MRRCNYDGSGQEHTDTEYLPLRPFRLNLDYRGFAIWRLFGCDEHVFSYLDISEFARPSFTADGGSRGNVICMVFLLSKKTFSDEFVRTDRKDCAFVKAGERSPFRS